MTLYSDSPLAKILNGEIVESPQTKEIVVAQPRPELTELQKLIDTNVKQVRVAAWWRAGQVEAVSNLLAQKLLAGRQLTELQGLDAQVALGAARHKVQMLLAENEGRVAQEASALGMPITQYGEYILESYKAQIEVQKERLSYEETFRLAITEAATVFHYQQALIKQIAELEEQFANIPQQYRNEAAIKAARREIRALIKSKQGELRASQSASFLQADRKKAGRPETNSAEAEAPEEQD